LKMTEIASRLTGFSSPIVGVSWNPPEAEVTAARRIIAFLEDRRVLYQPTEMENPAHCVQSVLEMRRFLTTEMGHLDHGGMLAQNIQAMRAACRKFLDRMQGVEDRPLALPTSSIIHMGSYEAWVFCGALGEMRGAFGLHIALIAVRNGLDIEGELASILPADPEGDDSDTDTNERTFRPR